MIRFIEPTKPNTEQLNNSIKTIIHNKNYTNYGFYEQELCTFLEQIIGYPVATCCNAGVALDILAKMFPPKSVPAFTFPATNTPHVNKVTYMQPYLHGEIIGRCRADWVTVPFGDFRNNLGFYGATIVDAAACSSPDMHVVKEWLGLDFKAVVVSLHATKIWPACEGAFVAFQTKEIRDKFKQKTNWGINKTNINNCTGGTNGKLSELHAAFAFASWENFVSEYNRRKDFVNELINVCKIKQIDYIPSMQTFWIAPKQTYTETLKRFSDNDIEAKNYYWHTQVTPESVLSERGVCIPTHVTKDCEKELIIKVLETIYE